MKITDIIFENPALQNKDKDQLTLGDVNQMFSDTPDLVDAIRKAYTLPKVKTWGDAIDVGSAKYFADQQKKRGTQPKKQEPQQKKSADKPTKPEKTTRASRFATAGSDAVSQGTGFISKAWQRGGRWSSALGIPKPKRD